MKQKENKNLQVKAVDLLQTSHSADQSKKPQSIDHSFYYQVKD